MHYVVINFIITKFKKCNLQHCDVHFSFFMDDYYKRRYILFVFKYTYFLYETCSRNDY